MPGAGTVRPELCSEIEVYRFQLGCKLIKCEGNHQMLLCRRRGSSARPSRSQNFDFFLRNDISFENCNKFATVMCMKPALLDKNG
jgi:hypothetical protein